MLDFVRDYVQRSHGCYSIPFCTIIVHTIIHYSITIPLFIMDMDCLSTYKQYHSTIICYSIIHINKYNYGIIQITYGILYRLCIYFQYIHYIICSIIPWWTFHYIIIYIYVPVYHNICLCSSILYSMINIPLHDPMFFVFFPMRSEAANYVDVVGFMPVVWRLYQAMEDFTHWFWPWRISPMYPAW